MEQPGLPQARSFPYIAAMQKLKVVLAAAALALAPQAVVPHVSTPIAAAPDAAQPPVAPSVPETPLAEPQPAEPAVPPSTGDDPEGQARADYIAWLAQNPDERAKVIAFDDYLREQGVSGVVPDWELLRTASMWKDCNGPRFEVAPAAEWEHLARTLRYVRDDVVPAIGPVQAVSGYRDDALNKCARGAPESAHRHFYAVDLVPVRPIGRAGLIRSMCAVHQERGREYDIGLGFYNGVRFHVDSKSFRRWGPDGSGATSPCVTEV